MHASGNTCMYQIKHADIPTHAASIALSVTIHKHVPQSLLSLSGLPNKLMWQEGGQQWPEQTALGCRKTASGGYRSLWHNRQRVQTAPCGAPASNATVVTFCPLRSCRGVVLCRVVSFWPYTYLPSNVGGYSSVCVCVCVCLCLCRTDLSENLTQ